MNLLHEPEQITYIVVGSSDTKIVADSNVRFVERFT